MREPNSIRRSKMHFGVHRGMLRLTRPRDGFYEHHRAVRDDAIVNWGYRMGMPTSRIDTLRAHLDARGILRRD